MACASGSSSLLLAPPVFPQLLLVTIGFSWILLAPPSCPWLLLVHLGLGVPWTNFQGAFEEEPRGARGASISNEEPGGARRN